MIALLLASAAVLTPVAPSAQLVALLPARVELPQCPATGQEMAIPKVPLQWAHLVACRVAARAAAKPDAAFRAAERGARDDSTIVARGVTTPATATESELRDLLDRAIRAEARRAAGLVADELVRRKLSVSMSNQAAVALLQLKFEDARKRASAALRDAPTDLLARRVLVDSLLALGFDVAASRVAGTQPQLVVRVNLAAGRPDSARALLEHIDTVEAQTELARLYVEIQEWDRAAEVALNVLGREPGNARAWLVACVVAMATQHADAAETMLADLRAGAGAVADDAVYFNGLFKENVRLDNERAGADYAEFLGRSTGDSDLHPASWHRRFVAPSKETNEGGER